MDGLPNLSPEEWTAVRLSVRVATVAMLASLPIGIAVAYLLARCKFPGKSVVDGIVLLPLILPPVVTGYLLLLTFGRRGLIGSFLAEQFGIVFSFRWTGAGTRMRRHGVSANGARDPTLDRGGRSPA